MNVSPTSPRPAPLPAAVVPRLHPGSGASESIAEAATRVTASTAGQATTPVNGSQVDLSETARQLFTLHQRDAEGADIDEARVQALRAAIATGELRIDAERIADGLIASACELLQTTPR